MLPSTKDPPALRLEKLAMPDVASAILGNLFDPVSAIRFFRKGAVLTASVPKAAVDKDCQLWTREDDVGPDRTMTWNPNRAIDSKPKATAVKERSHR